MKRAFLRLLTGFLAILALSLQAAEPVADEAGKIVHENWMIIRMQDKRCGYGSVILRERMTPAGKQFITDTSQEIKVARQGQELHLISRSSTVETEAGEVVSFQAESHGAGSDQVIRGYRVGDELILLSGGQKQQVRMPRAVLGPEAFDRQSRQMKLENGATFKAETFITDFPQAPVTMSATVDGRKKVTLPSGVRELWKLTIAISLFPGMNSTGYLDDRSETQLMIMPFPGIGSIQLVTTSRAEAMKELESIELFTTTLVAPRQPLQHVSQLKSATFRLTVSDPSQTPTLWTGPGQKVLESKPGECIVRVTMPTIDEKTVTWKLPHPADPALEPYLGATFYLEQTPEILALAHQAVGTETNPVRAAQKIQDFVRGYIRRKDLSVAFATAAETAASRTGDCTEHAVLCAALGRAVGLPTRTVIGFGYLPTEYQNDQKTGTFGFHMWAEAWIGPDQWVPMDAALGSFDVGHIAIGKTALREVNPFSEWIMPVYNLTQNLQIDVLDTNP